MKSYRRVKENLSSYVSSFLYDFTLAYRKRYSANHVLLRLIENWKLAPDKNKFVGAVLMDLSNAVDSMSYDLLKQICVHMFFKLTDFYFSIPI